MVEHEVCNKEGVAAAILASAEVSYHDAALHPFTVTCGRTKYVFRSGVTDRRATEIASRIRGVSARAWGLHRE